MVLSAVRGTAAYLSTLLAVKAFIQILLYV